MIACPPKAEEACAEILRGLILKNPARLYLLQVAESLVAEHQLPDALLAAGFVRNCVWDYLHQLPVTPLNDVDLIYFDPNNADGWRDSALEAELQGEVSEVSWEVKNQARMNQRHGDRGYTSSLDAMCYWPEQQTAVGIRLDGGRAVESSFGLLRLFAGELNVGPHRPTSLLRERASKKGWFERWPDLQLVER